MFKLSGVAQLVEQLTRNQQVASSTLVAGTIFSSVAQLVEQETVNLRVVRSSRTIRANRRCSQEARQ